MAAGVADTASVEARIARAVLFFRVLGLFLFCLFLLFGSVLGLAILDVVHAVFQLRLRLGIHGAGRLIRIVIDRRDALELGFHAFLVLVLERSQHPNDALLNAT